MAENEPNAGISDDQQLKTLLQSWIECDQERPLRLLVCGLGGVGKSTLVNSLLQLKDEKSAGEGKQEGAIVSKYERTTERGIKVCIFDTPGFGDLDVSNEEIVAMMKKKTEGQLDLLIYCISLGAPARVQRADIDALRILTRAYTNEIWKKAIIVLTFANQLAETKLSADDYIEVVENIKQSFIKELRKVYKDKVSQLPIVTAGYNPILKYEEDKSPQAWDDRLYLEMLKRVYPFTCVPFKLKLCVLM